MTVLRSGPKKVTPRKSVKKVPVKVADTEKLKDVEVLKRKAAN